MSLTLIKQVRLIDPFSGVDRDGVDLLLEDGVLRELGERLEPPAGSSTIARPGSVITPCFLDLHCHLREPGQPWKERTDRGTAAAAAGGFGAVCAMANLDPPLDSPARLRQAQRQGKSLGRVPVLQFAALTRGLSGGELNDLSALAEAGAAGFSDDGRHAIRRELLEEALCRARRLGLVVAIHPEDEELLTLANHGARDPSRWRLRPPDAEVQAIMEALAALSSVAGGRLHLQHLSTARGVELVRRGKRDGLGVTAEVTPHHLMLSGEQADQPAPDALRCNPPLRTDSDRTALWEGLLDGTIDALASDHAPHEPTSEGERQPGFSGVQLVLSAILGQGGSLAHLARLVECLTAGPKLVLGRSGDPAPGGAIRPGEPASITWFDPAETWSPEDGGWLSLGTNTPFWTTELRGAVLATYARGRLVHLDRRLVPELQG